MFEQGVAAVQVAHELPVTTNSVYQSRRRRPAGGRPALVSKGPGGRSCRLSVTQLDKLRAALEARRCNGWDEDQRWTLARVTTLIGRLFHVRYTLRGTSYLLHRIGFRLAAATGAYICFEDEAGQNLRPPKAPHLELPGPYPGGSGVRQGIGPGVDGRDGVSQTRLPRTPVLPAAYPPQPAAVGPGAAVPGTGGGGDSGWPAAGRWPGTPPACRSAGPARRSRRRSWCGLAPGVRAVGRELTQQRRELSLYSITLRALPNSACNRSFS